MQIHRYTHLIRCDEWQNVKKTVSTWRTRLIHWKLSSSDASGLCSATTTILSSCSTDTENTAILEHTTLKKNTVTAGVYSLLLMSSNIVSIVWKLWMFFRLLPPLPPPVHKLHGLHCQRCGNNVIRIVSPPTDHHQPIHLPHNKHKAVLVGNTKHILLDGYCRSWHLSNL